MVELILTKINNIVWGPPLLILMVGTAVFMTVRLKFLTWRNLGYAIKSIFVKSPKNNGEKGDISPFQSLMTALAATIGTGSIVGVATAIVAGGPGALVWMCITCMFGLALKYSESVLAVSFRETNVDGEMCGGPMYSMANGVKWKWLGKTLGVFFSVATVCASFTIGNMTQSNSISSAIKFSVGVPTWVSGAIIAILTFCVLIGGIKSIGKVCGVLVPFMAIFYILFSLVCIIANVQNIPYGLGAIFKDAFSVKAIGGATGGMLIIQGIRWGVARGVFSNESGIGTAAIAAAAAKTDHPSRQGYINMTGAFICTIFVCSMTGLVIASSDVFQHPVYNASNILLGYSVSDGGAALNGSELTIQAFREVLGPFGSFVVSFGLVMFAFSTILGWEYYGEKCLEFLFGSHKTLGLQFSRVYRVVYSITVFLGAVLTLNLVWQVADITSGLMALPNLICILILSNVVAKICFEFQDKVKTPEQLAKRNAKLQKKQARNRL